MRMIYKLVKLNKVITNHRLKFASVWFAHKLGLRHLFIRFDPVMACNLRCRMCHFSDDETRRSLKGIFTDDDVTRLAEIFFPKALQLVIGCAAEPTLYKNFTNLIKIGKVYKIPFVGFTSNGIMLTEQHMEDFIKFGLDELTLSVHGVTKESYEYFMDKSSYEMLHTVLSELEYVKKKFNSENPLLRINYTVNSNNLEELSNFFKVFGAYKISTLQIRPIIDLHGVYRNLLKKDEIKRYNEIINLMKTECKMRGIRLLANLADPTYSEENYESMILQVVLRNVSPRCVWKDNFNWKSESLDEFYRRTNWTGNLIRSTLLSKKQVAKNSTGFFGKHATKYEVL